MPNANPQVEVATRKAIKGHRDWLVWKDRQGETHTNLATADAYKAAMLDTGTKRNFTLIAANSGHFYRMTWPLAVRHWRNARRYGHA
jgi:hypothetical protein